MKRMIHRIALSILLVLTPILIQESFAGENNSAIELLGKVRLAGDMSDKSELSESLEDGTRADLFGGLSAIDYMGSENRFLLLSDRGAGDGAVSFPCRFHEATLTLQDGSGDISFELQKTRLLMSPTGSPLVGSLTAHSVDLAEEMARPSLGSKATNWTAFDPEGIRRLKDGSMLVTDEYGPRVVLFDKWGRLMNQFSLPERFELRSPVNGDNLRGAFPNRGFEGIAVTPDKNRLVAVIQSPLIQDGEIKEDKCLGLNCRWIVFDVKHHVKQQLVYQLEDLKSGVSEILAISESKFLVLERDSEVAEEAKLKRIYLVDISGASDVSTVDALPPLALPEEIVPVSKRLLIDLLDDRFGIGGKHAAEKPEGLSWGAVLADGRRTLWVCCDNDFDSHVKSEIYCFAVLNSSL